MLILPDYQQWSGRRTHGTAPRPRQESNERGWTKSFFSKEQARIKEEAVKLFAERVGLFQGKPPDTPMPAPIETGCEMPTNKAPRWAVTVFRRKRQRREVRNSKHVIKQILPTQVSKPQPLCLPWAEAGDSYEEPGCLHSRIYVTWDHFDGCVHFTPFVDPVKLPVQDKVPIICHHRTLEDNCPHWGGDEDSLSNRLIFMNIHTLTHQLL